jgi:gamma-glutamyl-gamma-aminobutyrate hydrolase PuuD
MGDRRPGILMTVGVTDPRAEGSLATRRLTLYVDAVRRAGGEPRLIDARTTDHDRAAAFSAMDGLLLTGGVDIEPARYGQDRDGSRDVQPARDALEAAAWSAAERRGVPVLGVCRGFQAINVFSGGGLVQHVDGHEGPAWGTGPALTHPIRLAPGSRLADLVGDGSGGLVVNSYHHQAVTVATLGPGLLASASSTCPGGDTVEGLEATGDRFVVGVQCHPERTESTPPGFQRLFAAFVEAARAGRPRSRAAGIAASAPRAAR